VDRALLDAGAAVGARPQHVRVDDPVLADQRLLHQGEHVLGEPLPLLLPGEQVRRDLEGVVALLEDEHLRRERLAGVPGRALRLAAAALGAAVEVEEALPGDVLDLAPAEDVGLGVASSKSRTLPLLRIGCAGPRPSGRRANSTLSGAVKM